ncbi:MAG: ABC transporter ATP-binding protein, partial [Sandaracinobacter sp.]
VLHDLHAAARAADQLLLLAGGRVLGAGAADAVLTPALLQQAYGVQFQLVEDPAGGRMPVPMG